MAFSLNNVPYMHMVGQVLGSSLTKPDAETAFLDGNAGGLNNSITTWRGNALRIAAQK